jgi:hypothetical protein
VLAGGVAGIEFRRAPNQPVRFGQVAALATQDPEQMQHFRAVGLPGQQLAITVFGFVESAGAMQLDQVFKHVMRSGRIAHY